MEFTKMFNQNDDKLLVLNNLNLNLNMSKKKVFVNNEHAQIKSAKEEHYTSLNNTYMLCIYVYRYYPNRYIK